MYIQDGKPVPTPDPRAGLYICNRWVCGAAGGLGVWLGLVALAGSSNVQKQNKKDKMHTLKLVLCL